MSLLRKIIHWLLLSLATLCSFGISSAKADITWSALPGAAVDVGAGGNGQVWVINAGQSIYRWVNGNWTQVPGAAVRVAVDAQGNAWVVNSAGNIYEWVNNNWVQRPGGLSDIGVGANGAVWGVSSNQQIWRWNGSTWTQIPGAAVRVSVDPQGNAWVVNSAGSIYTWVNNNWAQRPGAAKDVAACGNGDVYVIGTDNSPYKWNGSNWDKQSGSNLMNIGCDGQGRLFATNTSQQIFAAATATAPAAAPATTSATTTAAAPAAQQAAVDEPTEFYWRGSYGRGVGTPLDACPAGKQQRGALCYDTCRDGYSDHGTLTCSTNCPSGYTDMGAICHYNGTKSYSPVHWDNCKSRAPRWLGRGCIGGFVEDSCRSGFKKVASVCWADLSVPPGMSGSAWDPTKGTYNLAPVPMVCSGGKEQDAGLCYTPCRSGYNGVGPVCWASKPSGFVDCGLGYATDASTCGFLIADQVMGVISLVKDACTLTQFPGVSQACALGGSKYMQAKALAKLKVKSVAEFASNTALAAKTAERAQNMMAAIQKAQPVIDRLMSGFKGPVKALSGKGVTALAEFGESMAKVGDSLKDPDTLATLYGVVQTIRGAAGDPPYKPSGTQTEQAFKAIRDISSYYGLTVSLLSLTYPGFEASPVGQGMMATADVMGTVAAYLYTVKGQ